MTLFDTQIQRITPSRPKGEGAQFCQVRQSRVVCALGFASDLQHSQAQAALHSAGSVSVKGLTMLTGSAIDVQEQ